MRGWRRRGGDTESRIAADRFGRTAETLAVLLLRIKGYRILARRLRTPPGEIDLIAQRGKLYAFIEVKARADEASALESLTVAQRQRIEHAAEWWIARNLHDGSFEIRFDLVTATPGRIPRHHTDAWRPGV